MLRLKCYAIASCLALLSQAPSTAHAAEWPVPAVLVQSADYTVPAAGYAMQLQPVVEADPVASVRRQAALGGNVILWPGVWPQAVDNFPALVAEAAKYPGTFTHVYLIASDGDAAQPRITSHANKVHRQGDELFWCAPALCMGQDEDLLIQASRLAHAHGLKTICTFLPDVVLHPAFRLKDVSMCDAIAIDVYFSIRPTVPDLGACRFSENYLANLWHCSIAKLERMGHHGDKACIAQAFALRSESPEALRTGLTLQRQALAHAKALGCNFIVPWGQHLSAEAYRREPDLGPLPADLAWMVQP